MLEAPVAAEQLVVGAGDPAKRRPARPYALDMTLGFLGIVRDVTGSYSAVLLVCVVALELGAAIVILAGIRFANTPTA